MLEPKSTVKVYRIEMTKEKCRSIPERERNFLFLSSQAFNQINTLQKILIFSTNFDGRDELEEFLSSGQTQVMLRYLIGALSETWEMIKRPHNQRLIGQEYATRIHFNGLECYARLKKTFGSNNLLNNLRNDLAYHFPTDNSLTAAFENMPDEEDLSWYVSFTNANTFYLGSDKLLTMYKIFLTGKIDPQEAYKHILDTVMNTANDLVEFLSAAMRAIIVQNFGVDYLNVKDSDGIEYGDVPHVRNVIIPFFTYR